jgi:molybdopterin molybdotransferase
MVSMRPIRTSSPYAMVAVEEALSTILAYAATLPAEPIASLDADGRVLAEDVVSGAPLPSSPRSAVDGYAVRSVDSGERALISGEVTAGRQEAVTIAAGQAVRIMTGAPLPAGADAVVMVEETAERDGQVEIRVGAQAGANVHRTGQDIEAGQPVLSRGTVLRAPEIGLLATVGRVRVAVHRQPRVAVLATGDELVEPWEEPPPGCIRDSNRYAVLSAVRETGALPTWSGIARDDEADLEAAFERALENADVVITSGGVSMGTRDLIKPLLERRGTIHFGRVNFKPGKPLTFASVDDRLVFGLPGFPVSSLVTFEVFVRPALLQMQGRAQVTRARVEVELLHDLHPDHGRPEYQRAVVSWQSGRLVARTTGGQGSSRLLSMAGANALLEIRPADHPVPAGQRVPALLTAEIVRD